MNLSRTVGLAKTAGEALFTSAFRLVSASPVASRLRHDLPSLVWPACQGGLARLICSYSGNARGCQALARVTGEFRGVRASGQLLFVLGLAGDAHQLGAAISKSLKSGTVRPAAAQATRSLTSWSAVWAGAELFGTGGALLGLASGPGAVVASGVGALVGGCVGLFASDWLARRIEVPN